MKWIKLIIIFILSIFGSWASPVPGFIHFQGRVTTNGIPFNGTGMFKFALVRTNPASVTLTVWSHDGTSVAGSEPRNAVSLDVTRGLYSLGLGDTTVPGMTVPLGSAEFSSGGLWLRVWFDDGVHGSELLSPDQPIGAVGYAYVAESVPDGSISSNKLSPDALRAEHLQGILNSANLPMDVALKSVDLAGLSNQFSINLASGLQQVQSQLAAISNQLASQSFDGLVVASPNPSDPGLLGRGFRPFYQLTPPAWLNGTTQGEPSAVYDSAYSWTGDSLLVWGGNLGVGNYSSQGSAYSPSGDQWTSFNEVGRPSARCRSVGVWTGSDFIVWGGYSAVGYLGNGAAYHLATGQWRTLSALGAPSPRDRAVAGWTGSRVLVWGGRNSSGIQADGFLYDPVLDSWQPLAASNSPAARYDAGSAFAPDRLFVWGGIVSGQSGPGTGAQLLFDTNGLPTSWIPMTTSGAPNGRVGHTTLWTGTKLLVWGGKTPSGIPYNDGACFDPISSAWTPISRTHSPSARYNHLSIWTGVELVVFGGESGSGTLADGAAYNPALDRWRVLDNPGTPQARSGSTVAWTSHEMVLFGGQSSGNPINQLQRVSPQPTWNLYSKP